MTKEVCLSVEPPDYYLYLDNVPYDGEKQVNMVLSKYYRYSVFPVLHGHGDPCENTSQMYGLLTECLFFTKEQAAAAWVIKLMFIEICS